MAFAKTEFHGCQYCPPAINNQIKCYLTTIMEGVYPLLLKEHLPRTRQK